MGALCHNRLRRGNARSIHVWLQLADDLLDVALLWLCVFAIFDMAR